MNANGPKFAAVRCESLERLLGLPLGGCDFHYGLGHRPKGTARVAEGRQDGDGYLCNTAQSIPSCVRHRDRLTSPLCRRADGSHEAISREVATYEIAARIKAVVNSHGASRWDFTVTADKQTMLVGPMERRYCAHWGRELTSMRVTGEKTGDFWINGHMR